MLRVNEELLQNGNDKAVFNFDLMTAFEVTVRLSNSFSQEVTPQVTPQDIPKVKALIECMNNGEDFMREELQEILKLKDRENFRLNYLKPALDESLIEMTIPDKPTSKLQRYKLTYKGKRLIDAIFKK